jgi:hypothetical protein
MKNIKSLSNSFETTLKDPNLQDVVNTFGEIIIDGALEDGILKDIPFLGTLIGLGKTVNNVRDTLFLRKIVHFISKIEQTDPDERKRLITEIEKSAKYRIKVGEKLLYIIDKCEDHINAEYVARMFNAFLAQKITYNEFLRSSSIIQKILISDLEEFLSLNNRSIEKSFDKEWGEFLGDFESSLINSGLCISTIEDISIKEKFDPLNDVKLVTEGGKTQIKITEIGKRIKDILKN